MALASTKVFNLKGEYGGKYVTGTAANTRTDGKCWDAILAHEATVIASATSNNITGTLTSVPLAAGQVWYGKFTAFTLTSGKVTAYNAQP